MAATLTTKELILFIKARDESEAREIVVDSPLNSCTDIQCDILPLQLDWICGQEEKDTNAAAKDEEIVYNPDITFSDDDTD